MLLSLPNDHVAFADRFQKLRLLLVQSLAHRSLVGERTATDLDHDSGARRVDPAEMFRRCLQGPGGPLPMVYQFDSRQVRAPGNISLTTMTKVKLGHYPAAW